MKICPSCLLVPVVLVAAGITGLFSDKADPPAEQAVDSAGASVPGVQVAGLDRAQPPAREEASAVDPSYVLGFEMPRLDGTVEKLDTYKGKVILMVNVASRCGLTPQYAGLEKLYRQKKGEGFVILGFPANNFAGQEPGTNEQIAQFCKQNYDVTFPMFAKISVKGKDQHPLYKKLSGQPEPIGGDPRWNFDKFLIDRSGKVVARFSPRQTPEDKDLVAKIDELTGGSG